MSMKIVTCSAPVNIATIKYWGKRNNELILPVNSSLSVTLHQDQLCAKTSIAACGTFTKDQIWLNGVEQSIDNPRVQSVLKEIRRRCSKRKVCGSNETASPLHSWHVHICSENNFPTAAGLASSAAGYACLVYTLSKLYGIEGDISEIARQGSGSACRSVYGGYVAWNMGMKSDGSDSIAEQIASHDYWPDMRILVLVVNTGKKHTGSSIGMQASVATSELLTERIKRVPTRIESMRKAILSKDFESFAELTMKDSNQMHAVCLDTYPPISYMTDTSRNIQRLCHCVNQYFGENKVAYTFDAGPNACLYILKENVPTIVQLVEHFYPPLQNSDSFIKGPSVVSVDIPNDLLDMVTIAVQPGAINYVIHTQVGPGPKVIDDEESSLLNESGLPKGIGASK